MKIKAKPNTAIGFTYCVNPVKAERAKFIANKTKIICNYCLSHNIQFETMCFGSSSSEYEFQSGSLDNLIFLIEKNQADEVICVNYEDLSFAFYDYCLFKDFLDRNQVKLTAVNKSSSKNKEWLELMNKLYVEFKKFQDNNGSMKGGETQ